MAFIYTHLPTRATKPASDSPSVRHCAAFGTAPDCSTPFPVGFDPQKHPILARHWFGGEPGADTRRAALKVAGEIANPTGFVTDRRFNRTVETVHGLGPRAVGGLLMEIGEQRHCRTFIDQRLETYARLDPEIIRDLDGDRFPRPPLYEVKK